MTSSQGRGIGGESVWFFPLVEWGGYTSDMIVKIPSSSDSISLSPSNYMLSFLSHQPMVVTRPPGGPKAKFAVPGVILGFPTCFVWPLSPAFLPHFQALQTVLKGSWNRAVGKPKNQQWSFTSPQRNLKENLTKIPSLSFRSQLFASTPKKEVSLTEVKNTLGKPVNVQERVAPGCGGRGCTWFVWGSRSTSGAERTLGDKTVKEG